MSARKASPKPAKAPRRAGKSGSSGWKRRIIGLLLLALLALVVWLVAKNYHKENVRGKLEAVVGELDQTPITLRTKSIQDAQKILGELRSVEDSSWGTFVISDVATEKTTIKIRALLGDTPMDIELHWEMPGLPPGRPPVPPKPPKTTTLTPSLPKLALVIDDLGANYGMARDFLDLDVPITPAVLPYLAKSTEVAKLSTGRHRPFLLHMPMEPRSFPKDNPGQGAIMRRDRGDVIAQRIAKALESVPGPVGVNNHMGSSATESGEAMEAVMAELEKRGFLFLDSVTSKDSLAAKKAANAGIPWASRDVFLDNRADVEAIEKQLELAVREAKKKGSAIAIGHGRPETLKAIRDWEGNFEREGVKIVPITEIIAK